MVLRSTDPQILDIGGVPYSDTTRGVVTRMATTRPFSGFGAVTNLTFGQVLTGGESLNRAYSAQATTVVKAKRAALVAEFENLEGLTVSTAGGDDRVVVNNASSQDVVATTSQTGAGNDDVRLEAATANTSVSLGDGNDVVTLEYSDGGNTNIAGGAGADQFNLLQVGAAASTTLDGNGDGDTFLVAGGTLPSQATTTINGGNPSTSPGDVLLFDPGSLSAVLSKSDPAPAGSIQV